jgi:ubiquinone/menaquinone biosynthesis C-methylase UbiE
MSESEIVRHYQDIREEDRITSGLGRLELLRTQEVLRRHLPPPPARILDVGGGTGVHAEWLVEAGYQVHLIDLAPRHVDIVRDQLAARGVTAEVGDARRLGVGSATVDCALLLGPLYHLTERAERLQALLESRRVLKPGGVLAVAAINRFASLFDGLARGFFFDPEFRQIVARDLRDGQHRNPSNRPDWFTRAFFHRPRELKSEVEEAGFRVRELVGLEGLAGWLPALEPHWQTPEGRASIMDSARAVESESELLGLSAHLLLVAQTPGGLS